MYDFHTRQILIIARKRPIVMPQDGCHVIIRIFCGTYNVNSSFSASHFLYYFESLVGRGVARIFNQSQLYIPQCNNDVIHKVNQLSVRIAASQVLYHRKSAMPMVTHTKPEGIRVTCIVSGDDNASYSDAFWLSITIGIADFLWYLCKNLGSQTKRVCSKVVCIIVRRILHLRK